MRGASHQVLQFIEAKGASCLASEARACLQLLRAHRRQDERRARSACRAFPQLRQYFDCDMMLWTQWLEFHAMLTQLHRDMYEQEEQGILEAPDVSGDAQATAPARIRRLSSAWAASRPTLKLAG
eukprot:8931068-Pyramimonas_sp.AAC.1